MRIAVTGGAGFIGSHTVTLLLEAGHEVLILDSFANAAEDVPDRVAGIAGRGAGVLRADITDPATYGPALADFRPDAVIHFAGLKAVGEAMENPLEYYRVNVGGSVALFQEMAKISCNRLVFSSSATVYGDPERLPIDEDHPYRPTNPYGQSKRMGEEVIEDYVSMRLTLRAHPMAFLRPRLTPGSPPLPPPDQASQDLPADAPAPRRQRA